MCFGRKSMLFSKTSAYTAYSSCCSDDNSRHYGRIASTIADGRQAPLRTTLYYILLPLRTAGESECVYDAQMINIIEFTKLCRYFLIIYIFKKV